jgi:hypothetical protein
MSLATGSVDGMFHICSHYAKSQSESDGERRTGRLNLERFCPFPVNGALATTLALLRTSKELSG